MADVFTTEYEIKTWNDWAENIESALLYITAGCSKNLGQFIGGGYLEARKHLDTFLKHINSKIDPANPFKDITILDYGCGMGRQSLWFHVFGANVIGIDSSQRMINFAKALFPGPKYLLSDGKSLPVQDNSIDIMFSTIVLQHMTRDGIQSVIDDTYRALKPNGFIAIQLGCLEKESKYPSNPGMGARYSREEMLELLKKYKIELLNVAPEGSTDTECIGENGYHWRLHIARKVIQ